MNNDIYTSLSYHTEYCHCPKNHLSSAYLYLPASSTWLSFSPHQTSDLFIVSISLPFPKCHRVAIIYYEAFSDWLLSLGNMYLRFPYFFSWFDSSFVFGCAQFSRSFLISHFFPSGGLSIGASASASVLPVNNQDWSTFRWSGWISLQSKGLSRVFFNTTVQKHQFFGAQLSL